MEPTDELCEAVLQTKIRRYGQEVRREMPITEDAIAFVRTAAERVPLAIASGALREEIELVLGLADIRDHFTAVSCADDVDRGKPDPEGYQLALAKLNARRSMKRSIVARDTLAIEDSPAGVGAAKAAGLRCAAVAGNERAEESADLVIERLDAESATRILDGA